MIIIMQINKFSLLGENLKEKQQKAVEVFQWCNESSCFLFNLISL